MTLHPFTFTAPVDEHGLYASRQLADGHWLCVQPLLYGRAQLGITAAPGATVGEALEVGYGYRDVWHYVSREAAIIAMCAWDGEGAPTGWQRHPGAPTTIVTPAPQGRVLEEE